MKKRDNLLVRALKWYVYLWWVGWSDLGDTKRGRALLKRECGL